MKNSLMSIADKILLRKRALIETVKVLSKILCKWKQDSVVSLFLSLNSVFIYRSFFHYCYSIHMKKV